MDNSYSTEKRRRAKPMFRPRASSAAPDWGRDITVTSEAGKASAFTVTLPLTVTEPDK